MPTIKMTAKETAQIDWAFSVLLAFMRKHNLGCLTNKKISKMTVLIDEVMNDRKK